MENKESIQFEKLPYEQFKLLGMDKNDVLSLPESTMKALLSGNRTSLIQFNNLNIHSVSEPVTINARLSMQKKGDTYELRMHPVNLTPKNNLDLSQKEIDFLQKDRLNVLPKMVIGKDGKLVDSFVSFDKATNDFVAVKKDSIKPPESINDISLTESQKSEFSNGKAIQVGKDKYQLDVNSEQGISGTNLKKIKFKSGEYNSYNLLADAALIISGLGVLVLVEHLAKLAFRNIYENRQPIHELLKQDLKPAIKRTMATIAEKASNGIEMSNVEKNELLVVNLKDTTKIERNEELKVEPSQAIKKEEKPKFTYEGKLMEHGNAPYEFNKDNKDNYFVKLETDKGEKVVWGIDFNRAMLESEAILGDKIGIIYEGNKQVKVTTDIKDANGAVIGEKEKMVNRNVWDVQNLDIENRLAQNQSNVQENEQKNNVKSNINHQSLEMADKQPEIINSAEAPKAVQTETTDQSVKANIPEQRNSVASEKEEKVNTSKIDELKAHISNEESKENKAVEKFNTDEIKLAHPEQRQAGETKSVLKNDETKQLSKAINAKEKVTNDEKEIVKIKSGFKR